MAKLAVQEYQDNLEAQHFKDFCSIVGKEAVYVDCGKYV